MYYIYIALYSLLSTASSAFASPNRFPSLLVSDMLHLLEDSDDHAMPTAAWSNPPR